MIQRRKATKMPLAMLYIDHCVISVGDSGELETVVCDFDFPLGPRGERCEGACGDGCSCGCNEFAFDEYGNYYWAEIIDPGL